MRLTFTDISKSYGATVALRGVTVSLEPGIHALLGPNGSGKSTLMNILTDNLRADAGRITFAAGDEPEEDVRRLGVRFRERVGFLPQYPGMYPNFTVEGFLWYMAALKGMGGGRRGRERKDFVRGEIARTLEAVELAETAGRRVGTLSGGMRQRLGLAQAVLGDPDVLVLDEPTAGLDPMQRIAVRNLISRIALDRIVIFATHVVSDVEYIARSAILLRRGDVIRSAPPHALIEEMTGRVFRCSVPEAEVGAMQRAHRVTDLSRDERDPRRVVLRIIADRPPLPDAEPAPPTLEDYYLFTYGDTARDA